MSLGRHRSKTRRGDECASARTQVPGVVVAVLLACGLLAFGTDPGSAAGDAGSGATRRPVVMRRRGRAVGGNPGRRNTG